MPQDRRKYGNTYDKYFHIFNSFRLERGLLAKRFGVH